MMIGLLRLSLKGYNLGQMFEKNVVQDLVGKIATSSICRKKKKREKQRIELDSLVKTFI
jgi:hypothetical protein